MFEVGFTEIVLIFGIALLVLGPARLPKLAADLGRWAGRARAMARQLRTQLEQEVQFDPLATTTSNRPATGHGTIHPTPPAPETALPADDRAHTASPPPADITGMSPTTRDAPLTAAAEHASSSYADTAPTPTTTVPDEPKPG
ncbi:MAG: preprotein translocase subunit TatB [Steroidobacteraceae bacterium]|nr:preprotein translocase subunit TatB [Steroidobacteraceae bacterium]